jgi:superfamily II DNA or RNA helicase
MSIILRNYQEKAISQLGHTGIQVLSICPGGGKTYTAIEYINRSKFKRVLILAHGTNVLKSQWEEELTSLGIEHSTDLNSNTNIWRVA